MAGLLVRELKLRGLIERILVVCPANLSFQWQRELKEKFDEKFVVLKGSNIRDQFGVNQWMEQNQIITSLDLAKRTDILPGLRQMHWDLVISPATADRHITQGRSAELHAIPATARPGRLRRRAVHQESHGTELGTLLPAPHQGSNGLLSRAQSERLVDDEACFHQTYPAHG